MAERRIKFGYVLKADLQSRIASGEFDAYDIIYTSDTHEQYIVSPELFPIPIKGKVTCYLSVAEAVSALNSAPDTYPGQIISILSGDKYIGYMVNKNVLDTYYVTPLWEHPEPINYNELNNKPITNVNGTMTNPVVLNELAIGTYNVIGYMVCPDGKTISSVVGNIVVVGSDGIIRISNAEMVKYTIINGEVAADRYITEQVLESYGYATESSVELKIAALDCVTHAEMEAYIAAQVKSIVVDEVDKAIDEKIGQIEQKDIISLFTV